MYLVSVKAYVEIEDASVSNQELCATQNATIVYITARSNIISDVWFHSYIHRIQSLVTNNY